MGADQSQAPIPLLKLRWAAAVLLAAAAVGVAAQLGRRQTPLLEYSNSSTASQTQQQPEQLLYPLYWKAPFYTGSGYGTEAISFVAALIQTGRVRPADVWISHSGDHIVQHAQDSLDGTTRQLLQAQEYSSLSQGGLERTDLERPAIAVCHSFPDCWAMPGDGPSMDVPGCPCTSPDEEDLAYRIGRTMFESAGLPSHLAQHCNAMDEVWVPTEFNKHTFISAGVSPDKIRVVPQGIDTADFDPNTHEPLVLKELPSAQLVIGSNRAATNTTVAAGKPFVFLAVFKWEIRKGWDVLLESYLRAFAAAEPVELHIITKPFENSRESVADQVRAWLARRAHGNPPSHTPVATPLPSVYIHTDYIGDATYRRLYASADCVVLPTRGEGWGRPAMEAMSMALPLITTNWSGPTAYINEQVAYPLAYDNISSTTTGVDSAGANNNNNNNNNNGATMDPSSVNTYFVGQQWAQPSAQHLRELMREVYTRPAAAAAKGRAARQHILEHFSLDALATVVLQEVMRIQEKLGPDRKLLSGEEREVRRRQRTLCHTHPYLCSQGPGGMAMDAARLALPSFTHYQAHHHGFGGAHAATPGRMSVQELLARARAGSAATGLKMGMY